jgi:hypothetical protein
MLSLVIATSILALILLAAAIVELACRWAMSLVRKLAARRAASTSFEADERFGRLAEPNQFQAQ